MSKLVEYFTIARWSAKEQQWKKVLTIYATEKGRNCIDVQNSLHNTQIMLNDFLRHLPSANPASIEAWADARRQRIQELEESLRKPKV